MPRAGFELELSLLEFETWLLRQLGHHGQSTKSFISVKIWVRLGSKYLLRVPFMHLSLSSKKDPSMS